MLFANLIKHRRYINISTFLYVYICVYLTFIFIHIRISFIFKCIFEYFFNYKQYDEVFKYVLYELLIESH